MANAGQREQVRSMAGLKKIAPNWVSSKQWVKGINRSYLDCTTCDVKSKLPKSLVDTFLDPSIARAYSAEYWSYQNQIELKQKFGQLSGPLNQYQVQLDTFNPNGARFSDVYEKNRGLTNAIKNRMIDKGTEEEMKSYQNGPAEKALASSAKSFGKILKGESISAAQEAKPKNVKETAQPKPATQSTHSVASLKQEQDSDWLQAKLGTKSDFVGMRGQLYLNSKLFNSEVDVVANRPLTDYVNMGALGTRLISNMNLGSGLDRQNSEVARFKLYRDVPLVDAKASWMYGATSQTMTSSISKQFTSFLRAELSRVDFMANPGQFDQRAGLFLERTF